MTDDYLSREDLSSQDVWDNVQKIRAVAEEWGGRLGSFRTPDDPFDRQGTPLLAGVVIRSLDVGQGSDVIYLSFAYPGDRDHDHRIIIHREDLFWIMDNPVKVDS